LSTGALQLGRSQDMELQQRAAFADMSWMSSFEAGAMGSTAMSRSSSLQKLSTGSHKSSRAQQQRLVANNHLAKNRWMASAILEKSYTMTEGSPYAVLRKELLPNMPKIGDRPGTDVFKSTSEFYREGIRRMQLHHAREATRAARGAESPASSRKAPSSRASRSRKSDA
jgi:hypothetical protein